MDFPLKNDRFVLAPIELIQDTRLQRRHVIFLLSYYYSTEQVDDPGNISFEDINRVSGYNDQVLKQIWAELHQLGWLATVQRAGSTEDLAVIAVPNLDEIKEED